MPCSYHSPSLTIRTAPFGSGAQSICFYPMNPAHPKLHRTARAAIVAVFTALPAAGLLAQNSTFLGSVSGQQWNTAANWSAGVPNAAGAVANIALSGGVSNLVISNPGLGYTAAPGDANAGITLAGGNSTVTATAVGVWQNRVAIINVTNGGSGYTSAPTVVLSGGGGTVQASATANIDTASSKVVSVSIQYGGYGFSSAPTVSFTGGGGTGAAAEAFLALGLTGVNINPRGTYTTAPTATVAAPTGTFTTATAIATLTSGGVGTADIIPTVAGAGYVAPPAVTFAAAPSGGITARGYAVLSGSTVSAIKITQSGSGYLVAPAITIAAPNTTAAAAPNLAPIAYVDNVGGTYPYTVGTLNFTYGGEFGRASTSADILKLEQISGTPAVDVSGTNSLFFYASLAGTQGFNKTGNGTLTFRFNPDANTIAGPIGINAGTLAIQSDSTLGDVTNSVTIAGGARLLTQPSTNAAITIPATRAITLAGANAQIGNASPYTGALSIPGNITGAGGLTKTDSGVLILTGNNTYAGDTTAAGGLLVVARPATLPGYRDPQDSAGALPPRIKGTGSGALTVRMGGTGEWLESDFDDLINNAGTFTAGNTIGVDTTNATGTVTIDGLLSPFVSNPTYGFAKSGPGTVELTGSNGYTGPTVIFEGTLKLSGGDNRLPSTTPVTFSNNATLDLGSTNQNIRGLTLNSPAKVLGNGTLTLEATTADINVAVTASGTSLDFSGLSNFTFNGNSNLRAFQLNATNANVVNTAFLAKNGVNQFDASSVRFGGGGGNFAGQNVLVGLGQTNNFNVSTEFVVGNFQGSGNVSFQSGLTNPTFTVRGAGGTGSALRFTIANTNSGNQPTVGIFNATGGTVDIQATTLYVSRHFANASGTTSTGNFTFSAGTITADTFAIAAKSLNDSSVVSTGAPTITGTVNQNGGNVTATTVSLGLNVNTELPNLIANYNLNAGQLRAATIIASGATFGNSTVRNLTLNGGTLRNITGGNLTVTGVSSTAQGRINLVLGANGGTFNADSASAGNIILGGNTTLSGNGTLTKTGAGTLTVSAPAYSGNTTVAQGKVALGAANTANESSTVSIASGAVLELNFAGSDTVDKLFLNAVQQPAGTYTSAHVSGAFAGSGSLVVTTGPVVSDTTPPVITRVGPASVTVDWGSTYIDAGATATDETAPANPSVSTSGAVNTAVPGVYTLTYNATDAASNAATPVTRTVTVAIANATTPGADGLTPLMRYAFGANGPSEAVQAPATSATATTLSITAVVRTNDAGVVVTGEAVNDLTGTWGTGGTVTVTSAADQTNLPANCERRVYSVDITGASRKFLRLKVVGTF